MNAWHSNDLRADLVEHKDNDQIDRPKFMTVQNFKQQTCGVVRSTVRKEAKKDRQSLKIWLEAANKHYSAVLSPTHFDSLAYVAS